MEISVTDAKARLTDLVRRAEAGEEVVLTLDGRPAARLVPVRSLMDASARRATLESIRAAAALKPSPGPSAEHSQDFLYDGSNAP